MIAVSQLHVNDRGLFFSVEAAGVDLSSATAHVLLQKPDGTLLTVPASFETDGTDGRVGFFVSDEFDQAGTWRAELLVATGPEQKYSSVVKFRVYPDLPIG